VGHLCALGKAPKQEENDDLKGEGGTDGTIELTQEEGYIGRGGLPGAGDGQLLCGHMREGLCLWSYAGR
jgi:hypothetical protein